MLLQFGTVWFADDDVVRDGWALRPNQPQRTTISKNQHTRDDDEDDDDGDDGARPKYEECLRTAASISQGLWLRIG